MFRRVFLAAALVISITTTAYAETCHDLVISYLEHDKDPREIGDTIKTGAQNEPVLMETTAYCSGTHGSHGDRMREGYVAFSPESYGSAVTLYEAIQQDNGSYTIGDMIAIYEVRDTGYGYSTGQGESEVREDKQYAGTIESGLHVDVYRNNYARCVAWMQKTKGKCFAVIVPAKG